MHVYSPSSVLFIWSKFKYAVFLPELFICPFRIHDTSGSGFPVAVQLILTEDPSIYLPFVNDALITGISAVKRNFWAVLRKRITAKAQYISNWSLRFTSFPKTVKRTENTTRRQCFCLRAKTGHQLCHVECYGNLLEKCLAPLISGAVTRHIKSKMIFSWMKWSFLY